MLALLCHRGRSRSSRRCVSRVCGAGAPLRFGYRFGAFNTTAGSIIGADGPPFAVFLHDRLRVNKPRWRSPLIWRSLVVAPVFPVAPGSNEIPSGDRGGARGISEAQWWTQ